MATATPSIVDRRARVYWDYQPFLANWNNSGATWDLVKVEVSGDGGVFITGSTTPKGGFGWTYDYDSTHTWAVRGIYRRRGSTTTGIYAPFSGTFRMPSPPLSVTAPPDPLDPGAVTGDVSVRMGVIEGRLRVNARLEALVDVDPALPRVAPRLAGVQVEPYIALKGRPSPVGRFGASVASVGGVAITNGYTPPTPALPRISADLRWRSRPESIIEDGLRWIPDGGSSLGPAIVFPARTPRDPALDGQYSYAGAYGRRSHPAVCFNGKGYGVLQLDDANGTAHAASATFAWTFVPHDTREAYWGIFETKRGSGASLAMRYVHGRVDVFYAERKVVSYEVKRTSVSQPVLLMLALDAGTDVGRLLVVDPTGTSTREFALPGASAVNVEGVFGALGQGTSASPYRYVSDQDVLEFDYWSRALGLAEMRVEASLLTLAYEVGQL